MLTELNLREKTIECEKTLFTILQFVVFSESCKTLARIESD